MNQNSVYDRNSGNFDRFMQIANTAATMSIATRTSTIAGNTDKLNENTENMRNELNNLGSNLADGINELSRNVVAIGSRFEYGMSLLASKLQVQEKQNKNIIYRLGNIETLLQSPDGTRAKEWFDRGIDYLSKQLLEEALAAFLKSKEVIDANFLTNYYIGKLYLFGADDDENIIDVEKAIELLDYTLKVGRGELLQHQEVVDLVAETAFNAGLAYYIKGISLHEQNADKARNFFVHALKRFEEANLVSSNSKILEAHYHSAKIYALIGDKTAVSELQYCIKHDILYARKAYKDADLESLHTEIPQILDSTLGLQPSLDDVMDDAKDWLNRGIEMDRNNNLIQDLQKVIKSYPHIYSVAYNKQQVVRLVSQVRSLNDIWQRRKELIKTYNGTSLNRKNKYGSEYVHEYIHNSELKKNETVNSIEEVLENLDSVEIDKLDKVWQMVMNDHVHKKLVHEHIDTQNNLRRREEKEKRRKEEERLRKEKEERDEKIVEVQSRFLVWLDRVTFITLSLILLIVILWHSEGIIGGDFTNITIFFAFFMFLPLIDYIIYCLGGFAMAQLFKVPDEIKNYIDFRVKVQYSIIRAIISFPIAIGIYYLITTVILWLFLSLFFNFSDQFIATVIYIALALIRWFLGLYALYSDDPFGNDPIIIGLWRIKEY